MGQPLEVTDARLRSALHTVLTSDNAAWRDQVIGAFFLLTASQPEEHHD